MKIVNEDSKYILTNSSEDIDAQTFNKIRGKYSEGEELKLHRLALEALIAGEDPSQEYIEYLLYVKECVGEGKKLKNAQIIPGQ